jgi:predicted regulator of Ras-like GTPase activity (Roadblock/LC7/MglB family)
VAGEDDAIVSGPFRQPLEDLGSRVEGFLGVSLLGLDGIAIDSLRNRDDVMLESLGAELGSFVKSVRISSADLNVGSVEQFSLVTERYITILSAVTAEYFVLLVLDRNGNFGRARYELQKLKFRLRDELS